MQYSYSNTLSDFLKPLNTYELSNDEGYKDKQIGKHIQVFEDDFPDIEAADVVLIGCNENRGAGAAFTQNKSSADIIRSEFYNLFYWHKDVTIADAGNIKTGAELKDTYAALKTVVSELVSMNKKVLIIGGSHDMTTAQYEAYAQLEQIVELTCCDARIDMDMDSVIPADFFMMPLLTSSPNYIRHYNHIGFQSYFVHPSMLETIDKLRFDCFRVGKVKENIEEMEPIIRNSSIFSFDISAIQHSHAPCNRLTPNGLTGEEACTLMQYAGMSANVSSTGIYGYHSKMDEHHLTAKQISHMLWYFVDGVYKGKQESLPEDHSQFKEYHIAFAEMETIFLQSRKTGRWWMQLPDGKYIPCSYLDYVTASHNDIPERWLRAVERS